MQVYVPMEKINGIDRNALNRLDVIDISLTDLIQHVLNYALLTARQDNTGVFVCVGDSRASGEIVNGVDHDDLIERILNVNIFNVNMLMVLNDIKHLSLFIYWAIRKYIDEMFKYIRTNFKSLIFEYQIDVVTVTSDYFVIKVLKKSLLRNYTYRM